MVQTTVSPEQMVGTAARPARRGFGVRATGSLMVLPVVALVAAFTI
jgi:hypothetical protein